MSYHIFNAHQIRVWLSSGPSGSTAKISFSEIRETPNGVVADYDTSSKMGRVTCWFAGFCEFEILDVDDGRQVYFRHEDEASIGSPVLAHAYSEFLAKLAD